MVKPLYLASLRYCKDTNGAHFSCDNIVPYVAIIINQNTRLEAIISSNVISMVVRQRPLGLRKAHRTDKESRPFISFSGSNLIISLQTGLIL